MNIEMHRVDVYQVVDSERDYQDTLWTDNHSWEEWFMYIDSYVHKAKYALTFAPTKEDANYHARENVRKIAALAVAAMENLGGKKRE